MRLKPLLPALLLMIGMLGAQTRTITGQVTVAGTGETLPGAQLIVKDTFLGTTTDADGVYNLEAPEAEFDLLVTFVGYKTSEQTVATGVTNLNFALETDVLRSEEVVVTGIASSVKRKNLAHSVASISSADLVAAPTQTLESALSGKFPGITVRQNTGAPGGGMSVNLRGTSTLFGATQPLYVVDGVIINNAANQSGADLVTAAAGAGSSTPQGQPTNRVGDINPQDIETIEVLKGASAAAIYGSKAANGVIIITTKRGKPGAIQFRISQRIGTTSILKKLGHQAYGSYEDAVGQFGADLSAEGLNAAGVTAYDAFRASVGIDSVNSLAANAAGRTVLAGMFGSNWANVDIDYEDELYGVTGALTETNISVGGGTNRTRFYVGATIKNDQGIVKNTGYSKFAGQLNLDHRFSDRATLSLSTNFIRTESDRGITGNDNTNTTFGFSLAFTPSFVDIRADEDGIYRDHPSNPSNPLHTRDVLVNNEVVFRSIVSFNFKYNILQGTNMGLNFIAQGGADFYSQENNFYSPPELQFEKNGASPGNTINNTVASINSNLYLSLAHRLNMGGINLSTTAGVQWETADLAELTISGTNVIPTQTNVDQAVNLLVLHTITKQQDRGFFVQEEVNIGDLIYLTGALRGDRSSVLGNTDDFLTYPKASASFRLSELPFWAPLAGISDEFKLRVAWGKTGNLPSPSSKFTALLPSNIGGLAGLVTSGRQGKADVLPETTTEIEYGFDASFLGGFASLEFTLFQQEITDLLLTADKPASSGFFLEVINGGKMETKGIEAALTLNLIRTPSLEWNSRINFYKTESEVTQLDIDPFNTGGFATFLGTYRIQEGWSPTAIVGSEMEDGKDKDGNTIRVHTKLGDETPDFQMSFNNIFRVGPLGLRFLVDWKNGGDVINLGNLLSDLGGTTFDYAESADFKVTINGKDTTITDGGIIGDITVDQAGPLRLGLLGLFTAPYIEDGSYIKLRELAIDYSLPKSIINGLLGGAVDYLTLSLTGRNLWMSTPYTGYDPEVSQFGNLAIGGSVDTIPFPSSKSIFFDITFGL